MALECRPTGRRDPFSPRQSSFILSPSPTLPQELLDKIIDILCHDFETLKCCSVASSMLHSRSQMHIFSTICIYSLDNVQRLRNLVDTNSTLLGNVRELKIANISDIGKYDTDIPYILRMAISLRSLSILSARCSWSSIHRNTRDALIQAFRSPSLVSLSINLMYSFPIPIFALDINVPYLALKEVTFDAFTGDFPSATSADYSRMAVHTLEVSFSTVSLVHTVIELPNSFITRIRRGEFEIVVDACIL
ncbi:hypothetical protein Hypma_004233 [Hypsizygus marmoreus]|uniref:F-box domain-containing protein n=1 Tax=Hypsizygus marmoreus TaxID=39966 RepID=A0A369J0B6_HYPMA|nr:hypothetical protein Hypma_004233 [Hypsizygus marmoreus]